MNVQAHISGQISGQVPNQAGTQLPVLPQQNGNAIPPQMQNLGGPSRTIGGMDPEVIRARSFMHEKILGGLIPNLTPKRIGHPTTQNVTKLPSSLSYEILLQRHQQPITEMQRRRFKDIVKRLEEGLFRLAQTKEDYMNLDTLEMRLHNIIKRPALINQNQQYPQIVNNSSPIGAMIPTPGMSHSGNSNMMVTSSMDASMISSSGGNSIAPNNVNTGNMLPTGGLPGGSFNRSDGPVSNGYQQSSANFSVGPGGNMSSMNVQRVTSQMIPTPGFSNNTNQSYMNPESSSNGGGFSTAESTMVSQPQQQKQQIGSQNSRILQNIGVQLGSGIRSNLQQKPYGFSNGALNGGLGLMANNIPLVNEHGASEGYMTSTSFVNSPKPLQHQFDQHPRPVIQGDGYGISNVDSFGSGNYYGSATSVGSIMNSQNLNSVTLSPISKTNSALIVKREPDEHHNEVLHSQVPEQFQLADMQNQFQNSAEDHLRGAQQVTLPSGQQDVYSSLPQNSQQMQQPLNTHELIAASQNDFGCVSVGAQSEPMLQGQWLPQSQDGSNRLGKISHEQHLQEDFRQRISGQDEAQRNNLSSDGVIIGQTVASRGAADVQHATTAARKSANANTEKQFINQQRWLLFLRHARRCSAPEGKCQELNCITVQKLWKHIEKCSLPRCTYPRCHHTKILLHHHKHCRDPVCPVCVPVQAFLAAHMNKLRNPMASDSALPGSVSGSSKSFDNGDNSARMVSKPSPVDASEDIHPSMKRMKIEHSTQALVPESSTAPVSVPLIGEPQLSQDTQHQEFQQPEISIPIKSELSEVKLEVLATSGQERFDDLKKDNIDNGNQGPDEPVNYDDPSGSTHQDIVKPEREIEPAKQENAMQPVELASGTKSGKPKIKGVSLTELFTPEQVREHIIGLRQWVGQSKAKAEKNQAMEHSMSENSCQLCAVEKLTFEPPPIYCTPCGARIKRNAMYYCVGAGDTRHYFCIPCYNEARGDTIVVDGTTIPKARLEKKKNDEETEEWWVQCDKCEAWQHQICALFNGRRNDGGQAEYTCPNCYIQEVERGERKPLPQSAVLGAKDLPKTILSDHIEQRLFKRLKQERQDRAKFQGKSYDQVPGAEYLVVRVVSSVDKKLEVKQRFLEIFQEENYPTEFPYKSKKIEGVEVCLFGMYVQEFGSEAQFPNQRRVYLSYLDSVKYFRPEIKAVTGEALRTFVYHEILIGYLEYCKKRGFTSCYIWACPPLKGEDYILYCHPEIQKTPKSDKLREWYLSMLRKAAKENIVVDLTNLYDHFFVSTGECKAKVTAARLPYFDGDYWPGAAEDLIYQLRQEEDGRKQNKKGTTKKTITKRALKASGQSDLSGNASKDLLLMHKLGETICPMKEDFIMVHLQHACSHCCILMVSGSCWVCDQCKNFRICEKCYEAEQKREERERHPVNQREKHSFHPVEITDVPVDTKDKDEILESEFFDTRQAFLSLCQGNHYQYDTLRRAKHSSMMVLYHLHNPTAPAFVTTCNICHLDIETGQGWRCEVCTDYDVCNACYQKDGNSQHPHKLTNHPSIADRDAQNKEARQMRVQQLRKMLDLLVHASQCRSAQCLYHNCRKVKGLFRHGIQCKTRASGGCVLCKRMWYLLQLHARACKESECHVPRCRDLKEHLRRLQQQSDSRRRAAVMEMMRQRAAELTSNTG
ncbi:hypothetical protein TIFTF001_017334 [Ficus carica]|uniref:histone acetyltransferase n=1 Tax=Ficus carica TaxID=3494 RepID=A0AA88D6W6_FICCA|nr:hypothetical protein TIFTF001_017334 [Ficus carica]